MAQTTVPLDRRQLVQALNPAFNGISNSLLRHSIDLEKIAADIEDIRRSKSESTILQGMQIVYANNTTTNRAHNAIDDIQKRVQYCIEDLSTLKCAQEDWLKPMIESAYRAILDIKATSEGTQQTINEANESLESISEGLGLSWGNDNLVENTHNIVCDVSYWVEELNKRLVPDIQNCKSSIATLKESVDAVNIEGANREARFRNSCIRSARDRITALSIAVLPSDETKPKEAVVPPHEILPRTVRRYWLALSRSAKLVEGFKADHIA